MDNPTNNYLYSILEDEYIFEGQAHTMSQYLLLYSNISKLFISNTPVFD